MRVVKPETHILARDGRTPYQFIEMIGRTCYKSTDSITDDSAVKFVKGLVKNKHYAMLEHFWIYFSEYNEYFGISNLHRLCDIVKYETGKDLSHFIHEFYCGIRMYVACPIRVVVELDDFVKSYPEYLIKNCSVIDFIASYYPHFFNRDSIASNDFSGNYKMFTCCEDFLDDMTSYAHDKLFLFSDEELDSITKMCTVHTVLFVCDRGVSHELVRHRVASFAQESTRYCNYTKDKFGNEITVIEPFFFADGYLDTEHWSERYGAWSEAMRTCEEMYNRLIADGATPQEARSVLPNSLKTEVIVTANEVEWQHIINLRYLGTTGNPHPQMKESMGLVVKDLVVKSKGRLHT